MTHDFVRKIERLSSTLLLTNMLIIAIFAMSARPWGTEETRSVPALDSVKTLPNPVPISGGGPVPSLIVPDYDANVYGDITVSATELVNVSLIEWALFEFSPNGVDWFDIGIDTNGTIEAECTDHIGYQYGVWNATWSISGLEEGLYSVRVTMEDVYEQIGQDEVPVYVDPTPPIPEITTPSYGQTVSGVVTIGATTTDENVVSMKVEYLHIPQPFEKGVPLKNQHDYGPCPSQNPTDKDWPNNDYCAPTAAGSCLAYWAANGFPCLMIDPVTGKPITQKQLVEGIAKLAKTQENTACTPDGKNDGTVVNNLIWAIRQWINTYCGRCNLTVYEVAPTFKNYKNELEECENVLVSTGYHRLTGNSVSNKQNPDGTYNVDFMDPWTGTIINTKMKPNGDFEYPPGSGKWSHGRMICVSPCDDINPWIPIGTDTDGTDGWSVSWDTSDVPTCEYYLVRATMTDENARTGYDKTSVHVGKPPTGPRHCEGLDVYFYADPDAAYAALKACEIDLIAYTGWSRALPLHDGTEFSFAQYEDACADPKIQLAPITANDMIMFDLNHNCTIMDYPGIKNPLKELSFRQALAHMIDKNYIVEVIKEHFGMRIDQPIPYPQTEGWCNASVITYDWNHNGIIEPEEDNYPWAYNKTRANELLDLNGFDDYDEDGIRNYPLDWPGVEGVIGVRDEPNLHPIKVCIRSDDPARLQAGLYLCSELGVLGIPFTCVEGDKHVLEPIVMGTRNYHIYTSGWIVDRFPPMYLHRLFHSRFWFPYGSNYVHGYNCSGYPHPQYPQLDEYTEDMYYAKSIEDAIVACKKFCGFHVENVVSIPLYSTVSYIPYKRNLVGVVNMDGYGIVNDYTLLNAYKCDDPETPEDESQVPIRIGAVNPPVQLNPLYSSWIYDWIVLDRTLSGGMSVQPYNLAIDQPWIFQDWQSECWYDPQIDREVTRVTYWIRKDVQWVDAETNECIRNFTAHDVEFSIWYTYQWEDCWIWPKVMDVMKTVVVNDYKIVVYFCEQSYWLEYGPTGPFFPKYESLPRFCKEWCYTIPLPEGAEPCTKILMECDDPDTDWTDESEVVQMISAEIDEIPLVENVDYQIEATCGEPYYCHNLIHFLRPLPPGILTLCYWTCDCDAHGYTLCDRPWQDSLGETVGTHKLQHYMPSVDGWAIFECNSHFFLETPPLGEIDWRWIWEPSPPECYPREGYYKIEIYDVVKACAAYCSRGDGIPSPNWFPGADLECYDPCHIGLYDVVTITSKYGLTWGKPPDHCSPDP